MRQVDAREVAVAPGELAERGLRGLALPARPARHQQPGRAHLADHAAQHQPRAGPASRAQAHAGRRGGAALRDAVHGQRAVGLAAVGPHRQRVDQRGEQHGDRQQPGPGRQPRIAGAFGQRFAAQGHGEQREHRHRHGDPQRKLHHLPGLGVAGRQDHRQLVAAGGDGGDQRHQAGEQREHAEVLRRVQAREQRAGRQRDGLREAGAAEQRQHLAQRALAHWRTFVLRTSVLALGAARRAHRVASSSACTTRSWSASDRSALIGRLMTRCAARSLCGQHSAQQYAA